MPEPIPLECEVCFKPIWMGWIGLALFTKDNRLKCGACCVPPRPQPFRPIAPERVWSPYT